MRPAPHPTEPLNSTTLKWCEDGELSPLDLQRVLERLCQSDPTLVELFHAGSAEAPCN